MSNYEEAQGIGCSETLHYLICVYLPLYDRHPCDSYNLLLTKLFQKYPVQIGNGKCYHKEMTIMVWYLFDLNYSFCQANILYINKFYKWSRNHIL